MTIHTCRDYEPGILKDGCERCAEHAKTPMLLDLDEVKMQQLWAKMVDVERHDGGYDSVMEAQAGGQLYFVALWLERYCRIDPWSGELP